MAEMIRKVIACEVKKIGDRVLEFIGSTETQDRDGEVILAEGWDLKNFKKNPVFMWAHNYTDLPIGKAVRVWKSEGQLKFHIEFAPKETYEFADTVYKLYDGGFLKATSVGFIPKEWEDGDGEKTAKRTYKKQELLELSGVPVPSNPDALVSAREAGVITVKEFEAVNKPETTENYHRIPVPGEAGKHEGHRIRTIDISKKEGIKALYCGECKVVITYLFDVDQWTMEEAQAWVREHSKIYGDIEAELKRAIPYRQTPLADEGAEWDAGKEVKEAEVDDLKIMCAIVEGDPENKTSYKLPHHRAGGDHACVWNGVRASAAVLMGARGGVDAPAESIAGAKTHIGKHYADFDKGDPPWQKGISQEGIKDELDYIKSLITEEGLSKDTKDIAFDLVREILRLAGNDIPDDIAEGFGKMVIDNIRKDIGQLSQKLECLKPKPIEQVKEIKAEIKSSPPKITLELVAQLVEKAVTAKVNKILGQVD